jgi:hypothetical protein
LNIEYDENLLNEVVLAIDYVLEHLEKKTSTPGDIHKFLTIVFYAQATLVECYTKIVKLDKANQVKTLLVPGFLFSPDFFLYFPLYCSIINQEVTNLLTTKTRRLSREFNT